MRSLILLLSCISGHVLASINQGMSESLDGEVAMKNLEAAQVKMEEKLNSMTNFIDQELSKAKESPVLSRRKRSAEKKNPLLEIPQNTVKDIIISMRALNKEFDELQRVYEQYRNTDKEYEADTDDGMGDQVNDDTDDGEANGEGIVDYGPEIDPIDPDPEQYLGTDDGEGTGDEDQGDDSEVYDGTDDGENQGEGTGEEGEGDDADSYDDQDDSVDNDGMDEGAGDDKAKGDFGGLTTAYDESTDDGADDGNGDMDDDAEGHDGPEDGEGDGMDEGAEDGGDADDAENVDEGSDDGGDEGGVDGTDDGEYPDDEPAPKKHKGGKQKRKDRRFFRF